MLDSKALTKVQSIILIAIIGFAVIGGIAAYIIIPDQEESSETIKIGVCADLDNYSREIWQGVVLAVEQINAEGGVLGRYFEVVQQDDDSYTPPFDSTIATNAMTKLITIDKADFLIVNNILPSSTIYQDIAAEHKKILDSGRFCHCIGCGGQTCFFGFWRALIRSGCVREKNAGSAAV